MIEPYIITQRKADMWDNACRCALAAMVLVAVVAGVVAWIGPAIDQDNGDHREHQQRGE